MNRTSVVTDSTITFNVTSRNTSSVPTTLSGTPAAVLYEDGGTTEITGAVTITADLDTKTGLNLFSVDTSTAGIEPGKQYSVVMSAGTVGGTSVVGQVVYEFTMESDAERAQRLYRTYLYPESTISTVTGNTTTQINFTDIIDAQTPADAIVGRIYSVRDATDGGIEDVVATAFTYPNATVERLSNAGAMSFTVAAGDDVWPVGFVAVEMRGRLTDTRAGYLDDLASGGANLTEVGGTGDHLTAIPWNAAWDAEVESEVTDAINASTRLTGIEGATFSTATDSLEAIRNRGDAAWTGGSTLSAASVADAVWDEAIAGHVGAGSFGAEVQSHALSSELPTNFSAFAITTAGTVTAGTVNDKTGYSLTQSFPSNFSSLTISTAGDVTAGTVGDKTGYSLTQSFPSNFSSLTISTAGDVTAGTVGDKTGYSLTQSFPSNFSSLTISTGGDVTAGTVSDKTGYSLAVTGLDAVTLSEPGGVPVWGTVTAREGLAWNVAFNRNKIISNSTEITLRNDADGADIAAAPVTATTSSVTRGEYA